MDEDDDDENDKYDDDNDEDENYDDDENDQEQKGELVKINSRIKVIFQIQSVFSDLNRILRFAI